MINAYGPTEAAVWATEYECGGDELGPPPIGRPIANTRVSLLDRCGEPAPLRVVGVGHHPLPHVDGGAVPAGAIDGWGRVAEARGDLPRAAPQHLRRFPGAQPSQQRALLR